MRHSTLNYNLVLRNKKVFLKNLDVKCSNAQTKKHLNLHIYFLSDCK